MAINKTRKVKEFASGLPVVGVQDEKIDGQTLISKFSDLFNHYKSQMFNKNYTYDKDISLNSKLHDVNRDIERLAKAFANIDDKNQVNPVMMSMNPNLKWANFAIVNMLIDSVLPDTVEEVFPNLAQIHYCDIGDTVNFKVKSSNLFKVTKHGNKRRKVSAQRDFEGNAVLNPKPRSITVAQDWFDVITNKRNLAEYAMKVILSLVTEMHIDIYNSINDTYASLPTNLQISGFTDSDFISVVQTVKAFNNSNAIAMGTLSALQDVLPTSDALKYGVSEEYVKDGYIRNYKGADIFEIMQKADYQSDDYSLLLDDTRIYILGSSQDKLAQVAIGSGSFSYEENGYANANKEQTNTTTMYWDTALISNNVFGIIDTDA